MISHDRAESTEERIRGSVTMSSERGRAADVARLLRLLIFFFFFFSHEGAKAGFPHGWGDTLSRVKAEAETSLV